MTLSLFELLRYCRCFKWQEPILIKPLKITYVSVYECHVFCMLTVCSRYKRDFSQNNVIYKEDDRTLWFYKLSNQVFRLHINLAIWKAICNISLSSSIVIGLLTETFHLRCPHKRSNRVRSGDLGFEPRKIRFVLGVTALYFLRMSFTSEIFLTKDVVIKSQSSLHLV